MTQVKNCYMNKSAPNSPTSLHFSFYKDKKNGGECVMTFLALCQQ